jgi:hypothetical protein
LDDWVSDAEQIEEIGAWPYFFQQIMGNAAFRGAPSPERVGAVFLSSVIFPLLQCPAT